MCRNSELSKGEKSKRKWVQVYENNRNSKNVFLSNFKGGKDRQAYRCPLHAQVMKMVYLIFDFFFYVKNHFTEIKF